MDRAALFSTRAYRYSFDEKGIILDFTMGSAGLAAGARAGRFLRCGFLTGSEANPQARIGAGYLAASRLWGRFSQGITVRQLITDSGRTPNLVASSDRKSTRLNS